jgi:Stress responsive A/B Barrel Domain
MFVHAVYFWLKDHLTPSDEAAFLAGARSLTTITGVHQAYVGVPAPTDRPIIERSYSYALVAVFANQHDHDRYQVDPIHDRFRDECAKYWRKVVIYDSVEG